MKYAIVESGGKQYKAVEGGVLEVDRLPLDPGANLKLDRVLLLADEGLITVGAPFVKDNPVWTKVIEHFKGEKLIIFNYSPKKRIRVKTGHRQNYTRLSVAQVGGSELLVREIAPKPEKVKKVQEPVEKVPAAKKGEPKAAEKSASAKSPAKTAKKAVTTKAPAKPAKKATKTPVKSTGTATKKTTSSAAKPAAKK
jgi:large subunit ribosomal protein L21